MTPNERFTSALDLITARAETLRKRRPDLVAIIDTDARNTSSRDGYPGGGQDGPRGNSELTPTEASASARMGRKPNDEYHRITLNMLDNTERALAALAAILNAPDRIAKLQTVTSEDGNTNWCWVARQHGLPYDQDWDSHRTTDFAGYLEPKWAEPHPVCRWVYDYTRARHCLPSEAEMLNYLQRRAA